MRAFGIAALVMFLIGLFYVVVPDPRSIADFPQLPGSLRSDLLGDTVQNPNLVAYYSQLRRDKITQFYLNAYRQKFIFGEVIAPVQLNHPPEEAYQYIRDQQESTFLEEYLYPFHGVLFVNGYEPLVANGKPTTVAGDNINFHNQLFASKASLRYYPTQLSERIFIYLTASGVGVLLLYLWIKAWKESGVWT